MLRRDPNCFPSRKTEILSGWRGLVRQTSYGTRVHPRVPKGQGHVALYFADTRLTRRLSEGSRILQIQMLDHVIVGAPAAGQSGYFSFKEAGVIS